MRKEKERLAREAAEVEKNDMEQSWTRYVKEWESLRERARTVSSVSPFELHYQVFHI